MKNLGGGGPRFPRLQRPASRTICATWRLHPLWPQWIAHTSCHHGGCTPTRFGLLPGIDSSLSLCLSVSQRPCGYSDLPPVSLTTVPEPIPCLTPSKALHYRAHLLQRRREGEVR